MVAATLSGPNFNGTIFSGSNIIHSSAARVVYGCEALPYRLIRMPGLTENVANFAIWHPEAVLMKMPVFLYSSICIGTNLLKCRNTFVKHQIL